MILLYWNGHNLFEHQLIGLYLRVRGMAVQFTSDVIRTIVVRHRHRLALLRNTWRDCSSNTVLPLVDTDLHYLIMCTVGIICIIFEFMNKTFLYKKKIEHTY